MGIIFIYQLPCATMCSAVILSPEKLLNMWKNKDCGTSGKHGKGFAPSPSDSGIFGCQSVTRAIPRSSVTPQLTPESDTRWCLELHPSLGAWVPALSALRNVQLQLNKPLCVENTNKECAGHWCCRFCSLKGTTGVYSRESKLRAVHFLEPAFILFKSMQVLDC